MTQHTLLLGIGILTIYQSLPGQSLDNAEVRLPYGELKELLARAAPPAKPETPKPALPAARLRFSLENGHPVIDATLRTTSFSAEVALIPLLGGDVALDNPHPCPTRLAKKNRTWKKSWMA
jgi:hypothetical protein